MRRAIVFATCIMIIAACSSFDAAAPTSTADGGTAPPVSPAPEGGTSGTAVAGVCADGQTPIKSFRPDFGRKSPWGGDQPTIENGELESHVAGDVTILRASGKVSSTLKAFADWSWAAPAAKHVTLTFDYSATNSNNKNLYSTIGCQIGLEGPNSIYAGLTLQLLGDPLLRIAGVRPKEPSINFDPKFDDAVVEGTHHATLEADVGDQTAAVRGSIDGRDPVSTGSLPTPFKLQTVSLQCGILYADRGAGGELSVEVSNVEILICP